MSCSLENKAIAVTGAGQGIGEATALLAASLGASVLVNDIDAHATARVAAEINERGGRAHAHAADISQWSSGQALVDTALARFGRLDGLVNNAGFFKIAPLLDSSEADFTETIAVNLVGAAACAQAAAAHMLERKSGAIVNIVSGAQCGMIGLGAYGASKGALASLTYAWAIELANTGVRLNAVSPMADTQMAHKTREYLSALSIPLPDAVPPASANAPVICYLLSDASTDIHGQVVRIDGGALALMTHPAIMAPVLRRESWTADAVAEAFAAHLAKLQQQLGVVQIELVR
ncbi:MAG TPA: SDR family NAD(P)-dependent oxidoreductase [Terricaulis sp.]|nr:SDR family NAD(P)-dependent oxidoreductase [Terricaulis sp.]